MGEPDRHDDETTGTPPAAGGGPPVASPRIGPYRLKREIGAGGMGVVYEAVDERLGRSVAIKVIGAERHQKEMRRRFEQERDVLATLRHPAIAHVYDAGEFHKGEETHPFIAMEYVVGARPVTAFAREVGLDVGAILEMFESLFDGLEHAHRRGIIHRDIKPANILVDHEGRARIIDFGLSLPTGARGAMESLHAEGGIPAGTLAYMSPEQRTGDPLALDHRSDIYSMALVLFETLAGERPRLGLDDPPDLRIPGRALPPGLLEVLRGALRADPNDRTPAAAAVRDAIRRCREEMLIAETMRVRVEPGRSARDLARWGLAGLAAALAAFAVFPLCCGVLPLCASYGRWATGVLASSAGDYQNVRVVSITAETLGRVGPGDGAGSVQDARARHAELMDRLVAGAARVIAWDLYFLPTSPHDESFAAGIERATEAGVPVVLMTRKWTPEQLGGRVAPALENSRALKAPGTGVFLGDVPWRVDLAARRGDGFAEPSFAMAAAAMVWSPGTGLDLELDRTENEVVVRHWEPQGPAGRRQVGATLRFTVSGLRPVNERALPVGLAEGDVVAQLMLTARDEPTLERGTVRYEDVLAMGPDELLNTFSGRAVVIGRTDEAGEDIKPHPGNRRVAGVYAHAEAIETLLRARQVRVPTDAAMRLWCAAAALVGFLSLFRGKQSVAMALIWTAALEVIVVGVCLAALGSSWIVYPAPVGLSALIGGAMGFVGSRIVSGRGVVAA